MMYAYSAKTLEGQTSNGILEADTVAAAKRLLRERNLYPLSLTARNDPKTIISAPKKSLWKRGVPKSELMLLTSQLVIMSRAGVDLAEALQNVAATCRNPTLKESLDTIYKDVAGGLSFSAAMRKQAQLFGEPYVASIAAGEATGKVPDVLARLAEMLQNDIKLQSTLKGALAYPLVLLGVCCIVVAALLLFVLPNFEKVFADLGAKPPASTVMLLQLSSELRQRFWLWGGIALAGLLIGWRIFWTQKAREALDGFFLKMTLVGDMLQSLISGRLFVMMGTMMQNGVSLIQALQLSRTSTRSPAYRKLLDDMQEEVLNGRTISTILNASTIVPAGLSQMVASADQSGKLGTVMQLVGEYYETEGQRKIQELAKLIEPLIIIVMGILVAFVVASIMLPMLDISSAGQ